MGGRGACGLRPRRQNPWKAERRPRLASVHRNRARRGLPIGQGMKEQRRPAAGRTIGTRLLTAQALVLVASISTAAAVAAIVGPTLFPQHLLEPGHPEHSPELDHLEMAYRKANQSEARPLAKEYVRTCRLRVAQ